MYAAPVRCPSGAEITQSTSAATIQPSQML